MKQGANFYDREHQSENDLLISQALLTEHRRARAIRVCAMANGFGHAYCGHRLETTIINHGAYASCFLCGMCHHDSLSGAPLAH